MPLDPVNSSVLKQYHPDDYELVEVEYSASDCNNWESDEEKKEDIVMDKEMSDCGECLYIWTMIYCIILHTYISMHVCINNPLEVLSYFFLNMKLNFRNTRCKCRYKSYAGKWR